jgi:hypothetical protein
MTQKESCDDANGNCKLCGHPFNPHLVIAFDVKDFSKGGAVVCNVEGCNCRRSISFDFSKPPRDA